MVANPILLHGYLQGVQGSRKIYFLQGLSYQGLVKGRKFAHRF